MYALESEHANRYGIKEAIVLHKVIFYVLLNKRDARNYREGRNWTYNSRSGWRDVFPFLSDMQIWRSFVSLEKNGAIVSGSFNRMGYDKTKWYSLSDALMSEVSSNAYWTKAIYNSAKPHNKNAKGYNKNATPIPVKNIKEKEECDMDVNPY
jgi:hypothetical protein